jgi:hypothetical protein
MTDNFNGDAPHLMRCIEALLELDAKGALVPHGIGSHARDLLSASAMRLSEIVDDASYELGRLLNHIHEDDGQYIQQHGWKKAAADALAKLSSTPSEVMPEK